MRIAKNYFANCRRHPGITEHLEFVRQVLTEARRFVTTAAHFLKIKKKAQISFVFPQHTYSHLLRRI
jgi:hypothetical protein